MGGRPFAFLVWTTGFRKRPVEEDGGGGNGGVVENRIEMGLFR